MTRANVSYNNDPRGCPAQFKKPKHANHKSPTHQHITTSVHCDIGEPMGPIPTEVSNDKYDDNDDEWNLIGYKSQQQMVSVRWHDDGAYKGNDRVGTLAQRSQMITLFCQRDLQCLFVVNFSLFRGQQLTSVYHSIQRSQ